MIAPTRLLCLVALVPLVPTVVLFVFQSLWPAALAADALALAVALADLVSLPRRSALQIRREVQPIATRGAAHSVTLMIENHSRQAISLMVVDDKPASVNIPDALPPIRIAAGGRRRLVSRVVPTERGEVFFEKVFVRCDSRLRLWYGFWW